MFWLVRLHSRVLVQPEVRASGIDGNLPATKLDNIDMSKVATGNLYYNRIQDFHLIVNDVIITNDVAFCNITETTSASGDKWLNFEIRTSARVDQLIVILH